MFWTYALVGLFFLFNLFYCESYEIPAVQFHVNRYGFEAWIPGKCKFKNTRVGISNIHFSNKFL